MPVCPLGIPLGELEVEGSTVGEALDALFGQHEDLLAIDDPDRISLPARPGEFGVGDPFAFPLQSVEGLAVLADGRLLIVNDNNYPASNGRWIRRDRPDDVELIVVRPSGNGARR